MRTGLSAVAALALAFGLAGCLGSGGGPQDAPGFDGQRALGFVEGIALDEDGQPRYRIPGTPGQQEAADYLWDATDVAGWDRSWQEFTGEDYLALERRLVRAWTTPGTGSCTEEDSAQVPGLSFRNLLVVRRHEDPAAPLVLLAAHWDSAKRSDLDEDFGRRDEPSPGGNAASGAGVLLQLMRELRGVDLPFDVGLVFLDGEDGHFGCYLLAGSLYYISQALEPVKSFILLDMVGDPSARFPREQQSSVSGPGLQDLLWSHGQARAPDRFTDDLVPILDSHLPTAVAGIPSVAIVDAGRSDTTASFAPQWLTTQDTVDRLDAATLALVGDVLLATLQDPALVLLLP